MRFEETTRDTMRRQPGSGGGNARVFEAWRDTVQHRFGSLRLRQITHQSGTLMGARLKDPHAEPPIHPRQHRHRAEGDRRQERVAQPRRAARPGRRGAGDEEPRRRASTATQ